MIQVKRGYRRMSIMMALGIVVMTVTVWGQEAAPIAPSVPTKSPAPAAPAASAGSDAAPGSEAPLDDGKRVPILEGMPFSPRKIVIEADDESLEERLDRFITLDVREMNVVDVLKFLALKGNFNLVTSAAVQGRVTLYLKNVLIRDALDIVLISNGLAYHVERSVVHVMTEPEYKLIYGKMFNDKNIVKIVQLQYARPEYVMSALENLKSAMGRIIVDQDSGSVVIIDTPASVERMQEVIAQIEQPLGTVVYSLQYAKAEDVLEKFKARIDTNAVGSVEADVRSNKLVVRAYPGRQEEVEKLIRSLDEPTKEVLIEAKVLQIVFKPQMDFGIDWNLDFRKSNYDPLKNLSFSNVLLGESSAGALSTGDLATNYGRIAYGNIDVDRFDLAIRALKQVSNTRVLSNPKIMVTNNEEAKIHIGDTVPYFLATTSGTGENAITTYTAEFVDVGLKLNVIPTINDDGFITMTLMPEMSTVVDWNEAGGEDGQVQVRVPQVNKTQVETTVMVKDGMTVVLGGLKKDNKVTTLKGIPVLMDMPLVGKLFRSESDSVESTEIVIFITPHIVTGDETEYNFYRGAPKGQKEYSQEDLMLKPRLEIKP